MTAAYFTSLSGEAALPGRLWSMLHDLTTGIVNVPPIRGRERMEALTGTEAPEVTGPEGFPSYRQWIDRMLGARAARKTLLAAAGLVSVRDRTWTTDRRGPRGAGADLSHGLAHQG
ncbi:MAG: hypothetical protein ACRDOI_35730 [Trebonia sp.]